jgi:hypothetical protein
MDSFFNLLATADPKTVKYNSLVISYYKEMSYILAGSKGSKTLTIIHESDETQLFPTMV